MSRKNQINAFRHTDTIISKDDTIISFIKTGNGPGFILVHGVLSVAVNYIELSSFLTQHFTVYSINRRGRGLSGPQGSNYSIDKESEDLDALQKHTGASYLFGHSYGGLITLEAARKNKAFIKIAVYEPGVSVDDAINTSWISDYQKYLAHKKYLDAFAIFSIKAGPESARKTPVWLMKLLLPFFVKLSKRQQIYDLLPSNLQEYQQVALKNNSYTSYGEISANVLLMFGGKSNLNWVEKAIHALQEVLPLAHVEEFPKLDHFGPDETGPEEISQALITYFKAT